MLKHYLHATVRALFQNKVYSLVNIVGLTTGLCACMIVATVVIDDLSYDRQWTRSHDLYRIISVNRMGEGLAERFAMAFAGLGPELKKNFSQVESVAAIDPSSLRLKFRNDETNGVAVKTLLTDTAVWGLLDFRVVAGNPRNYVEGANNLVITAGLRDEWFAAKDPVGRTVMEVPSFGDKPRAFLITGVIADLPSNTHLRAQAILVTKPTVEQLYHQVMGTFTGQYMLVRPGTDIGRLTGAVNGWYSRYIGDSGKYQFAFQPIRDVYLHSEFNRSQTVKGSIRNIYIFSGVAILLLLIACINFINLSAARVVSGLRATGIRKILGAARRDIILQSLTESLVYFILSTTLAVIFYQFGLRFVGQYLGHGLEETFLSRIFLFLLACGVILLVSLFTGIYPAWLLSGVPAAGALRGHIFTGETGSRWWLRKSLVILQFSISIIVLVGMIVVRQQVRFMEHADIGFDRRDLLSIRFVSWDGKGEVFKNELLRTPGVERCSISSFSPSTDGGYMSRETDDPRHPGNKLKVWYIAGDIDLAATLGLQLMSGRLFDPGRSTDAWPEDFSGKMREQPSLMTATTASMLGIRDLRHLPADIYTRPVGIIKDFHNESLREPLGPTFIIAQPNPQYGGMLIRVRPGAEAQVMASLQRLWRTLYPGKLLETGWVDDMLAAQYATEARLQQLLAFFSLLIMLLAALGVFGLIVHTAGQRVKEIGVRKVLGASVGSIVRLLSTDFARMVFIAALIACPVAWWLMNKWLEDFAYHIGLSWWMFGAAGGITLLIAMGTVGAQALRAAFANPIRSLREE